MKKKPVARPRSTTFDLALKAHEGTPQYGDYGHPPAAPAARPSDRRAEGGNVYDLSNEQSGL
jgi:hypothetical protein